MVDTTVYASGKEPELALKAVFGRPGGSFSGVDCGPLLPALFS